MAEKYPIQEWEIERMQMTGQMLLIQCAYACLGREQVSEHFDDIEAITLVFAKCFQAIKNQDGKEIEQLSGTRQMQLALKLYKNLGIEKLSQEALNVARELVQLRKLVEKSYDPDFETLMDEELPNDHPPAS